MTLPRQTTESPRIVQGFSSGDSGEDYDPEKRGLRSATGRGPELGVSRGTAERHNAGKASELADMPLDILDEVSFRISFAADVRMDDASAVDRYFLLSAR